MTHIVDIWSLSILEWPISTRDDFRITITLNTIVSLFISQVVRWLYAFVSLQNSNWKVV